MDNLKNIKHQKALICLCLLHLFIITLSNYLVQLPFTIFGFHTTWGAFTFPLIFLASDLTVRIFGASLARKIVITVMLPAMVVSYIISAVFFKGEFQGLSALTYLNIFIARIAIASFMAYVLGQMIDIYVFNRLKKFKQWWLAPACSTVIGNAIDTIAFFTIAFYQSTDSFMATHWVEIAYVDYAFKLIVSLFLFVPMYGVLVNYFITKLISNNKKVS